MPTPNFRDAFRILGDAMKCQHCGGSKLLVSRDLTPNGVEGPDLRRHCVCPGGPVWPTLVSSDLGRQLKLQEGQEAYSDLYGQEGKIAVWDASREAFVSLRASDLRQAILATVEQSSI